MAPENDVVAEHNCAQEEEFQSKLKKWDNYQGEVANGNKNAKAPDGMKKRPYHRDFKEPIIMYMCSTSYCLGTFDSAVSSCLIKCLKPFSNKISTTTKQELKLSDSNNEDVVGKATERYPFEGTPKRCSCPICACRCNFACYVSEVPKIML